MEHLKPIPLHRKLGWFVLLYAAGFLAMLMVATIFRMLVLDAIR